MGGKFIIVGGASLEGEVSVSGAKNSALPIMAAALLSRGRTVLYGIPRLRDVMVMKKVLECLGAEVKYQGHCMEINASKLSSHEIPPDLTRKLRASNLIMGALLARVGKVTAAYPGGCDIGSRPMDLHLKGFQLLGAAVEERGGFIHAEFKKSPVGTEIYLDYPSVGATENIILSAVFARGKTIIKNAAREPEIVDLQNFLNKLGAVVKGAGTGTIVIEGVDELMEGEHEIIPDRIEAATFMAAGAITRGRVKINNIIPEHLEAVIIKLKETGVSVNVGCSSVEVHCEGPVNAVNIKTLPYPGFPTDMQPQMMALLSLGEGTSIISETIFENRFKHALELSRMGADITVEGRIAVVKGVQKLSGTFVEATDLRAGAALILAGLAAEGVSVVENIRHIDRGYENIDLKLRTLGQKLLDLINKMQRLCCFFWVYGGHAFWRCKVCSLWALSIKRILDTAKAAIP
ncbi:MAG TPA: UDP-N-acetylglucosamine 1-carboxyvinyltransferase [Peptococcaceae bacterium]|nr:MAG: UDP-N-acetylglucosamine 1-carboxyvinyltransferase [Clostridia bacterium 41_269]HBT20108.1 UDP-N-acetylglucosamine 1-carboxyvinyltransferase [Peptococcaceae bacterium]